MTCDRIKNNVLSSAIGDILLLKATVRRIIVA